MSRPMTPDERTLHHRALVVARRADEYQPGHSVPAEIREATMVQAIIMAMLEVV